MSEKIFRDIDGNELKVGDVVLFGTCDKKVARARIVEVTGYGWLKLITLKNRKSSANAESVLLDKNYVDKEEE